MSNWQTYWNTLLIWVEDNPPRFVELLMLILAAIMAAMWVQRPQDWPYLVLFTSYVVGSATSIWVRTAIAPVNRTRRIQATGVFVLTLLFALCSMAQLFYGYGT